MGTLVPKQYERTCSAIDMLPTDLDFEDDDLASSHSGLSQSLGNHVSLEEGAVSYPQTTMQPFSPDTTDTSGSTLDTKSKRQT